MERNRDLDKKQILVVEDDFVLAREICTELEAHGAAIIGPAPTVHYARLIIGKRRLDGAVLDIKLFGEYVYDLADDLQRDGIPMLFTTAYRNEQIAARYRSADTLQKPIDLNKLVDRVSAFKRPRGAEPRNRSAGQQASLPHDALFDKWSRALARSMRERD
ncbi:response regulator [Pelagibacterium xiamenense]|uniref:response regulator n=1 Tax=Pelagibacterium xiamenense TaxID=2901140 RepID=UPI001E2C1B97|nr:response regulator [Pelagibacterium xiamenense]MCD7058656.1 response regulator [Pelagibacterium xiamenense]